MDWIIDYLVKQLKDPAIVVLAVFIVALFKLLIMREKANQELVTQVGNANVLLAKLTTLVEILVYRKEGSK